MLIRDPGRVIGCLGGGHVADYPAGVSTETVYGPFGQVAERREGGEVAEAFEFDALGLPVTQRHCDGSVARRYEYDTDGLPIALENGEGQRPAGRPSARASSRRR